MKQAERNQVTHPKGNISLASEKCKEQVKLSPWVRRHHAMVISATIKFNSWKEGSAAENSVLDLEIRITVNYKRALREFGDEVF